MVLSISTIAQTSGNGTSGVADAGYRLLNQRAAANQNAFYVYVDSDSGFNHGVPSGFVGDSSLIHVDSGCLDNPSDLTTGCRPASDRTALDMSRGTVLRFSVDPLAADQVAGVNIWDPNGTYDVSGAESITFEVRSPKGIYAQFGVGGCVTGYTPIAASASYQTVSIDLNKFKDCKPDITQLKILFGVTFSGAFNPDGGTILLDNIRFTPVPRRQLSEAALGLPLSTQVSQWCSKTTIRFLPIGSIAIELRFTNPR